MRGGLTFEEAREYVRATTVFTTHTPVPAGHDRFGQDLVRRYFSDVADWLGLSWERFYSLGARPGTDEGEPEFNMTYLAMNFASRVNGVSELHATASRHLFRPFWPGLIESERPVASVTNGVHLATWAHPGLAQVLAAGRTPGALRPADFGELDAAEFDFSWAPPPSPSDAGDAAASGEAEEAPLFSTEAGSESCTKKTSYANLCWFGDRGKPFTAAFAQAKAAQRSLAQSFARQLGPEGIHVALVIVDGGIGTDEQTGDEGTLRPSDIAETVYHLATQPKSAWTFEVDVRPFKETW